MAAERVSGYMLLEMPDYRTLKVTHKARELGHKLYAATARFPQSELYGLRAQLQRAVVSIGSNIAEGAGRGTAKDFTRFLRMARGSAYEIEFQLTIAVDLKFLSDAEAAELLDLTRQLIRMLHALIKAIKQRGPQW